MSRGWLAFMWAIIGGVVGQLLGAAVSDQLPFMAQSIDLGFDPFNLDLAFIVITFGTKLKLSIGGAIGLVLALWLAIRNG